MRGESWDYNPCTYVYKTGSGRTLTVTGKLEILSSPDIVEVINAAESAA